jgi:hypothetical protein
MDIARGIQILVSNARYKQPILEETKEYYNSLEWLDERKKPTWDDIYLAWINETRIESLNNCKSKAKELIFNCDWSVLPDVKIYNRSEFESYRAILRDYILNPVENPDFPTEPVPKWIFTTKTMGDNNG